MGRRLDLKREIESDVYYAMRCIEQRDLEEAGGEQLLRLAALAGELAKVLHGALDCPRDVVSDEPPDPALEARRGRSARRSPVE
jgi:hypothetical protein